MSLYVILISVVDVDLDKRNINRDNAIVDDMELMQLGMTWT